MTQNNSTNTTGSICAEEYTVKRGDSFYLIAHKLGVPLRDLLAANRNIHPARLMVGDVLCIPREEDDSVTGGGTGGSGNTGGSSGSTGGNTGGNTGGSTGGNTGGNTGGSTGGNTGGGTGGNTGGSTGGNTGGSTGGNTGGNTGGSTGGNTGGSTGGNTGGSTGGNTGGSTGGNTEPTPNCPLDEQLIVQRGQTVADIQILNLLSRHTLETANPNVNLDALRVGQTLCVPSENVPCTIPDTYTLETSETLEAVAVRFNLPVGSILRANPCLAPQDFEAGVTVALPR